jgi:apolipoprotein N-acyltransferase
MGSRSRVSEWALALGVVAVSAVLVYFGSGLHPHWWLAWLAPVPILWFAGRPNSRGVFLVAAAAWFIGSLNWWRYLHGVIEAPTLLCIAFLLIPSLLLALCVLLWRRLLLRGRIWLAVFSLPVAWTAIGFIQELCSPNSTFGNMAYSQMDFLPLIQIASVAGIWGITFCLLLVPSAIAVFLHGGRAGRTAAAFALATFFSAIGFGAWRLHRPMETTGTIRTELMTNDTRGEIFAERDARSLELLRKYTAAAGKSGGAEVILIPEKIARFSAEGSGQAHSTLSNAAVAKHVYVLAGLDEDRGGGRRNDAVLFTPEGQLAIDYEKHHFVPRIEVGYVTGADYSVLRQPSGVWGVAICKDMDFPPLGRQYGRLGTGALLVPAWDFVIDDWYHARMAILRGVESGFSVARAAKQGLLTVSDNRGRILLERRGSASEMVSVEGLVPVAHAGTLYARWGDWFPWLCVAAFLLCVVMGFRGKVRKRTAG